MGVKENVYQRGGNPSCVCAAVTVVGYRRGEGRRGSSYGDSAAGRTT